MKSKSTKDQNVNQNLFANEESKYYLKVIAKWGNFISIVGGIFVVLIILYGATIVTEVYTVDVISSLKTGRTITVIIGLVYILMGLVYGIPLFLLYKYSQYSKRALESNNSDIVCESLLYLKRGFQFVGVTTIVVLGFLLVCVVLGVAFAGEHLDDLSSVEEVRSNISHRFRF